MLHHVRCAHCGARIVTDTVVWPPIDFYIANISRILHGRRQTLSKKTPSKKCAYWQRWKEAWAMSDGHWLHHNDVPLRNYFFFSSRTARCFSQQPAHETNFVCTEVHLVKRRCFFLSDYNVESVHCALRSLFMFVGSRGSSGNGSDIIVASANSKIQ